MVIVGFWLHLLDKYVCTRLDLWPVISNFIVAWKCRGYQSVVTVPQNFCVIGKSVCIRLYGLCTKYLHSHLHPGSTYHHHISAEQQTVNHSSQHSWPGRTNFYLVGIFIKTNCFHDWSDITTAVNAKVFFSYKLSLWPNSESHSFIDCVNECHMEDLREGHKERRTSSVLKRRKTKAILWMNYIEKFTSCLSSLNLWNINNKKSDDFYWNS